MDLRAGLEHPIPDSANGPEENACVVIATNDTPSYAIPGDDPFLAEVGRLVGADQELGANFGTDAGRLAPLGCRSVVFGPGDISVAHRPDEWIPVAELVRARGLLESLIR